MAYIKTINDSELQSACNYLQKQFDTRSWWPREQPGLAHREFKLMNGSAGALNVWCERWLHLDQCRKLEQVIRRENRASTRT